MKTTVSIDSFGELYLTCTIKESYLCNISLEMLQKAFDDVYLNAKAVRSGDVLEIVIDVNSSNADLNLLNTLSEAALSIISAAHAFETAKLEYQKKLNTLVKDLSENAKTEPASSPKKKDNSKGQKWKSAV